MYKGVNCTHRELDFRLGDKIKVNTEHLRMGDIRQHKQKYAFRKTF